MKRSGVTPLRAIASRRRRGRGVLPDSRAGRVEPSCDAPNHVRTPHANFDPFAKRTCVAVNVYDFRMPVQIEHVTERGAWCWPASHLGVWLGGASGDALRLFRLWKAPSRFGRLRVYPRRRGEQD